MSKNTLKTSLINLLILFLSKFPLIASRIHSCNMFRGNSFPKPVSISKRFAIADYSFTKMDFGFRLPIQAQIHPNMVKNIIGTPKHSFSNGFNEFTHIGFRRFSIIPCFQEFTHSLSLRPNSLFPFPINESNSFSKIEEKDSADRTGRHKTRNDSNNNFFDSDFIHSIIQTVVIGLVRGKVIGIIGIGFLKILFI